MSIPLPCVPPYQTLKCARRSCAWRCTSLLPLTLTRFFITIHAALYALNIPRAIPSWSVHGRIRGESFAYSYYIPITIGSGATLVPGVIRWVVTPIRESNPSALQHCAVKRQRVYCRRCAGCRSPGPLHKGLSCALGAGLRCRGNGKEQQERMAILSSPLSRVAVAFAPRHRVWLALLWPLFVALLR